MKLFKENMTNVLAKEEININFKNLEIITIVRISSTKLSPGEWKWILEWKKDV